MPESDVRGSNAGENESVSGIADATGSSDGSGKSIVWVIGGEPTNFTDRFKAFGNPVLVCSWSDHARNPSTIIERLIHSVDTDRLAICGNADPAQSAYALAVWLTLHKVCNLIAANNYGGMVAHRLSTMTILKATELARREYEGKKTRP